MVTERRRDLSAGNFAADCRTVAKEVRRNATKAKAQPLAEAFTVIADLV